MKRLPLRARLLLWFFGLAVFLLAGFSAMLYAQTRATLLRGLNLDLRARAERLAARVEAEDGRPSLEPLESRPAGPGPGEAFLGGAVFAVPERTLVGIVDSEMELRRPPPGELASWFAEATPAEIPAKGRFFAARSPSGEGCRVYCRIYSLQDEESREEEEDGEGGEEGGKRDGAGSPVKVIVTVASGEEELRGALSGLVVALVTAWLVVVFAALAAGWFLAARIGGPLRAMAQAAERIHGSELDEELALAGNGDEIDRLASTLNRAFKRLREAFGRQKHFTADASHEMRTPLSVIRTQAEVALARERDGAFYRETLSDILEAALRMQELLEALLLLSRVDDGKLEARREDLDLSDLAREVAEGFRERAAKGSIELRLETPAPAILSGDPLLLGSALANLLSNALDHTPPGKAVTVSASAAGGMACLEVRDEGEGIPPEALPRLFERFFRVDEARSRGRGGVGLGLAIVKAVAELHGGRVSVDSEPGKGTAVRVEIPLA